MKITKLLKEVLTPTKPRNVETMLQKYPALKKSLVGNLKITNPEVINSINLLVSTPSTFEIELANGQKFKMEYTKIDFIAIIGGERFYLDGGADVKQSAQKQLNVLLNKGKLMSKADQEKEKADAEKAAEETSAETPTEETPAEETPAEETPAEETPEEELPLTEITRLKRLAGLKEITMEDPFDAFIDWMSMTAINRGLVDEDDINSDSFRDDLYDIWEDEFSDYEETGQSLSTSDYELAFSKLEDLYNKLNEGVEEIDENNNSTKYKKGDTVKYQVNLPASGMLATSKVEKSKNVKTGRIVKASKAKVGGYMVYTLDNGIEISDSEIVGLAENISGDYNVNDFEIKPFKEGDKLNEGVEEIDEMARTSINIIRGTTPIQKSDLTNTKTKKFVQDVLSIIDNESDENGISRGELAKKLGKSQPQINSAINKMIEKGWLANVSGEINSKSTPKEKPSPTLSGKRFDGPYIEKKINSLASKGYIIKKQRSESDGSWYYKIQEPEDLGTDRGIGIGYTAFEYKTTKPNTDYFYHNSHGNDDNKLGNVWNHKTSDSPGPGGWYTFDQKYIEDKLNKLSSQTPKEKEAPKPTPKQTPLDIIKSNISGVKWNDEGNGEYWGQTNDRGPRTDHGGGEDGEDWMSSSQIEQYAAPYRKKWQPRIDKAVEELKKAGYKANGYMEYGEKGHISLFIKVK